MNSDRQVFRVLTCTGDTGLSLLFLSWVQDCLGDAHVVKGIDSHDQRQILELLHRQSFDLIVAMINNIIPAGRARGERIRWAAEFLVRLKARYGIPIIADCGLEMERFDLPLFLRYGGVEWLDMFAPRDDSGTRDVWQSAIAAATSPRKPPRIVILDDEEGPREWLRIFFRRLYRRAEIVCLDNEEAAIVALESRDPDLFTTDLTHAGLGGIDLVKLLIAKRRRFPIFIISAAAQLGHAHRKLADYLKPPFQVAVFDKPVSMPQLLSAARKHLGPEDSGQTLIKP